MLFYPGVFQPHQPHQAHKYERCFISVSRLKQRKSPFRVKRWIMDSGAFTTIDQYGGFPEPPYRYAEQVIRWHTNGELVAAVSQDYMCEPHMLARTGLSVADHQRLTIERYDQLRACVPGHIHIMPVLQGYELHDYVSHIHQYGDRLTSGLYVGVGSVCKRNTDVGAIEAVLHAVKGTRPDLRIHTFGLKTTALESGLVRDLLHSADSMAWALAAWREGRDANCWTEADKFARKIDTMRTRVVLTVR